MATMFGLARTESLNREEVLRGEIKDHMSTIGKNITNIEKESAASSAQMTLLTSNMSNVRNQLDINAKFSTDALEPVRTETASKYEDLKAQFDAMAKSIVGTCICDATGAGGTGALSSSDIPLVNKDGQPEQVTPTKVEPFSLQC